MAEGGTNLTKKGPPKKCACIYKHVTGEPTGPQIEQKLPPAHTWVQVSGWTNPPNAVPVVVGKNNQYIGRAMHEGDLVPGKVNPNHKVCYIAWGGKEHSKKEYELLTGREVAWIPASGGQVPEGALPAGKTKDGEVLYVGRAVREGIVTVGKVHPSNGNCFIPYDGKEWAFKDYEVLVPK